MTTTPTPAVMPPKRATVYMSPDTNDVPEGPVTAVRKLKGGIQNNVFLLERGGASFVLRLLPG